MTAIETILENYLAGDLRALCKTRVGYPILSTSFAGVELLGALLSPVPFDWHSGDEYFKTYWSSHLYPDSQALERAHAIYKLARHGVAHQFFVKGEISIMSGEPWQHLTYDGTWLWIDTHRLAHDVIQSYERVVKPMLNDPVLRAAIDTRLNEIIKAGKADSAKLNLRGLFPATPQPPAPLPKPPLMP